MLTDSTCPFPPSKDATRRERQDSCEPRQDGASPRSDQVARNIGTALASRYRSTAAVASQFALVRRTTGTDVARHPLGAGPGSDERAPAYLRRFPFARL